MCEGGGALHTHPLLAGQVCMAWQWWQDGWWEWRESDEVVCHSPAGHRLYRRFPRLDWALPPSHGGGGCHSRPGGREGDKGDSGRMVGPPNHHPNTTHTPKGAGPPGGPSQVEVSKGRSGCVVASSVPLCLQEEGQGMAQGVAPPPCRVAYRVHTRCAPSQRNGTTIVQFLMHLPSQIFDFEPYQIT